jgi:hypothetical protein
MQVFLIALEKEFIDQKTVITNRTGAKLLWVKGVAEKGYVSGNRGIIFRVLAQLDRIDEVSYRLVADLPGHNRGNVEVNLKCGVKDVGIFAFHIVIYTGGDDQKVTF